MVVGEPNINNIMGGIENTGSVRLHNHRKKLKQRFDIIKKLGQGTYGKVQLGINKETGQEVAIKTIKKSKIETEADLIRIRREIQIMSSVQHPNIIHIYEVFENREKMVLVMEYAAGGELYDYLSERKVLAEEEARRIFRQIATACYYCHKHKICHRDLKLENILLDEHGNAKIADFGLSNVFDDQRLLSTFCGSPLYASPEIVKGTPYQGPEVDCWSLGVLLYTLVYGAMPFDGSNFKRLVRQISQGDYFEPKKPSRASPLIRDMLTVNPRNRANIEKICMHWWVNETYEDCCLDISEELANQTPVRLDLLLSLAPPAPQLESEKLVVTDEITDESAINAEAAVPTRSQSVGSLMDVTNSAERRIKDMLSDDVKLTPKRKLETTVSTDQANLSKEGVKRKDKIVKENTVADITLHTQPIQEEDKSMTEEAPLNKSATQTLSRSMDVEQTENYVDPTSQGAACAEIIEDAKKVEKLKKETNSTKSNGVEEKVSSNVDKENIAEVKKVEEKSEEKQKESKIPAKRKIIKKKVLTDKNDNADAKVEPSATDKTKKQADVEKNIESEEAQPPGKPVERRRSRIFETTEKFQSMISASESKSAIDKPKKIVIPGVNVGGFKKEFERKASLTGPSKISLSRKTSLEQDELNKNEESVQNEEDKKLVSEEKPAVETQAEVEVPTVEEKESDKRAKIQNAVSVISNALDGTRKSKSRPCMIKKPPVPFGTSGRSASGSIPTIPIAHSPLTSPILQPTTDLKDALNIHGSIPAQVVEQGDETIPEENKTSSAEITLKSATLPRRKTTKAEIKLDYPTPKPATMGFKTEMAHHVEAPPKLATQRSEVTVPLPIHNNTMRSASLEPETKMKQQTARERIIPISFESDLGGNKREPILSPPIKPPITKTFQSQRSTISQRSNSLSRQSTQESDSETTVSGGEPIRKSPREYIIPIAVEGGGYVTPRAGSLEPSETASTTSTMTSKSKFGRGRRFNDREGSEDESPFSLLHRHSSFGRESDAEDPRRDMFRMHSLRSSRPRKATIEHNDSFSSGEDDDDDGFEILTAENLFSTLLSRVRDLTQRINVDGRPSFPTSRLLSSHFDHGSNFWNMHNRLDPLSRYAPIGRSSSREPSVDSTGLSREMGVPWRRSASRDLATDIDSVFKSPVQTPTHTATLPRGDTNNENLNLTDLNLRKLKLSDEDALALSYLTPGLSRRIQKQLFAQLAPSEARKLSRTLSMRSSSDNKTVPSSEEKPKYKSNENTACNTLPRRYSVESSPTRYNNSKGNNIEHNLRENSCERSNSVSKEREDSKLNKSFLPVKNSLSRDYYSSTDHINDNNQRSQRSKSPNPLPKYDDYLLSPPTSTSDCLNQNNYNNSTSNYSDSSRLVKYLSPNKYGDSGASDVDLDQNSEVRRRRSPSARRTSRFLRPDFFDAPKNGNYYLKEKKEREIETQKVLKEIRDKRKGRFRDCSTSRESCKFDGDDVTQDKPDVESFKHSTADLTENLLKKVSDNIKNIESNVKDNQIVATNEELSQVPDYVNQVSVVNPDNNENRVVKKERVSKIARPKSYPNESHLVSKIAEFDKSKLKMSKLKKNGEGSKEVENDKTKSSTKSDKVKTEAEGEKQSNKSKLLQTIERKFEKLRSFSNSPNSVSSEDARSREEKKSLVEDTIKRLREQSLPRNIEPCITESAFLKRAVSVEDLTTSDPKQLQASRKSVTKILNLFKKYEEKHDKKNDKTMKTKKSSKEDSSKKVKDDTKKTSKNKNGQLERKTEKVENISYGAAAVITNNVEKSDINVKKLIPKNDDEVEPRLKIEEAKRVERPRSLLLDPTKRCQPTYNGAKSDTNITTEKDAKRRVSKLPVTSYRRSLNLENTQFEPSAFYRTLESVANNNAHENSNSNHLMLNLLSPEQIPSTSGCDTNRNSLVLTDDSSVYLSPCDDNDNMSYDSWSVCSDYHTQDLTSPLSPCNNFYSADENESVSDRIRRKSFYTRFNEKKQPRKNTFSSYRDLDLYKEMNNRKYGEPYKKEYVRSNSASLNESLSYVNSDKYELYGPKINNRRSSSVYPSNSEESTNILDDNSTAEQNRNYSYYNPTSRFHNAPNLSTNGHHIEEVIPSLNQNIRSSTSQHHL